MATMKKTDGGTLIANAHKNGISLGIFGNENGVSLEWDEKRNKLILLINDDVLAEWGCEVFHTSIKITENNGGDTNDAR